MNKNSFSTKIFLYTISESTTNYTHPAISRGTRAPCPSSLPSPCPSPSGTPETKNMHANAFLFLERERIFKTCIEIQNVYARQYQAIAKGVSTKCQPPQLLRYRTC